MLLYSFLVAYIAILAGATPAPTTPSAIAKAYEVSSTDCHGRDARPTSAHWWSHHGHKKWRSAWGSYPPSYHHAHHAHAAQVGDASSSSTPAPPSMPSTSSSTLHSTSTTPASSSATPNVTKNTTQTGSALPASAAAYLDPHNALRAKHAAQPLAWSDTLASAAQTWASKCHWAHSDGAVGNYGENIAAGTGNFDAASAVGAWASEESQYNPSNPVYSHYTQMVWKGTTQLGCAVASCPGLINSDVAQFHVCEYNPAGNIEGEFPQNIS